MLDPRTLLHIYETVGVVRRKDERRGLPDWLTPSPPGRIASRFSDHDFQAFASFMLARHHRYPLFFIAKHAWAMLAGRAAAQRICQALNHHVRAPRQQAYSA